jgi:uncharacterized repeat protein (TIGR01451 family)
MRSILLLIISLIILPTSTQAQVFQWAKGYDLGKGGIRGIDVDASSNNYITGSSYYTTTFEGVTIRGENQDVLVAKYDSTGKFQWVRSGIGAGVNAGYSISVDWSGNSYVTGYFTNKATFDGLSVETTGSNANVFIAKYNPVGAIQWVKKVSSALSCVGRSIDTDPLGNIYLTGTFNEAAQFDTITLKGNGQDIFIAKYNSKGEVQWAKQAGGSGVDVGNAISVDASGSSYVTGTFEGSAAFVGCSLTSSGGQDVFVAKYSSTGNLMWVKQAGGTGTEEGRDIGVDQFGNCLVMGRFTGTARFGHITQTSVNENAIFIAKYNTNGQPQWAKPLNINQYYTSYGYGLSVDQTGNGYVTGFFEGSFQFDNIPFPGYGKLNSFVAKCDPNGVFQWAQEVKSLGTSGIDVATDAVGNSYLVGQNYYNAEVNFGSIVLPGNSHFLTKLSSNANRISGRIFKDLNGNGTLDAGEPALANAMVQVQPGPLYTRSDDQGNYQFYTEAGNYTVSISNPPLYHTLTPAQRSVSFFGTGQHKPGNHFALRPEPAVNDVRVTLVNHTFPRPGFTGKYSITYQNVGTSTLSGTVRFEKDGLFEYVSGAPHAVSTNGNELSWTYQDLEPSQRRTITIELKLPATVALGTLLQAKASVDPLVNDRTPNDNTNALQLFAVGSYDPNDKRVSPEGKIPTVDARAEKPFTYTIRFQNTGTASAITVKVLDTLSQRLNVGSFEMLSSSHAYTYTLSGKGIVEWTFDNINLPDSTHNEPESHGFIQYRVKPNSTLAEGDTILNRSFIYFDYNAPIETNTTLNRISDKADQSIALQPFSDRYVDETPISLLSSANASSGLPVSWVVVSGPATLRNGSLSLTGIGNVVLKAAQAGNQAYNRAPEVYTSFLIRKREQSIVFSQLPDKMYGTPPFTLSASASSGLPVSFSIVSGSATIQGNTLTITRVGEVKVRALQAGNANYLPAADVIQSFVVSKAAQTIAFDALPDRTFGDPAIQLNATASSSLAVVFSLVSGPATLSDQVLTITGVGIVKVKAVQAGNANYLMADEVEHTFTVQKATQRISFAALETQTFGNAPLELSATSSAGLPLVFTVTSGPATVSGRTLTINGAGMVKVKASQSGNDYFQSAPEIEQKLVVNQATQAITFTPIGEKMVGDAPFELSAASNTGLPVSFTVVTGPASVTGSRLTINGSGEVKVQAMQAGNENYLPASTEQTFRVNAVLATEPTTNDELQVFPNPVSDQLHIELPVSLQNAVITLMDARGVLQLQDQAPSRSHARLEVAHLAKGLYLLRITHQQITVTRRIVIR